MNGARINQETLGLITATQGIGFEIARLKATIGLAGSVDRADVESRLKSVVDRQQALLNRLVDLHRTGEANGILELDQELCDLRGAIRRIFHYIQAA